MEESPVLETGVPIEKLREGVLFVNQINMNPVVRPRLNQLSAWCKVRKYPLDPAVVPNFLDMCLHFSNLIIIMANSLGNFCLFLLQEMEEWTVLDIVQNTAPTRS